jgi:hypothetical protein
MEGKIYQILKNHKLSLKKREEVLADLLLLLDEKQAKKMYSEEEVLDLLYKRDLYLLNRDEEIDLELPEEWFEQFKKKQEQ